MASMRDKVMAARSSTPARLYPLWTQWRLLRGGDHIFSDSTMTLAENILKRREATFAHMRNSPSAGGACMRQSVISFMGYKGPETDDVAVQHIFDNGNFIHLKWQMYLHDMGILSLAEVPLSVPEWGVVGTCDGIVNIPTGDWYRPEMTRDEVRSCINDGAPSWAGVLEIKGWNDYKWKSVRTAGQPDERTRWQGNLYATAAKLMHPDLDIQGTCYWLENKANSSVLEYDLPCTDQSHSQMKEYYDTVMSSVAQKQLPERELDRESFTCRYCLVKDHCERLEAKGKTTILPAKGATRGKFNGVSI